MKSAGQPAFFLFLIWQGIVMSKVNNFFAKSSFFFFLENFTFMLTAQGKSVCKG